MGAIYFSNHHLTSSWKFFLRDNLCSFIKINCFLKNPCISHSQGFFPGPLLAKHLKFFEISKSARGEGSASRQVCKDLETAQSGKQDSKLRIPAGQGSPSAEETKRIPRLTATGKLPSIKPRPHPQRIRSPCCRAPLGAWGLRWWAWAGSAAASSSRQQGQGTRGGRLGAPTCGLPGGRGGGRGYNLSSRGIRSSSPGARACADRRVAKDAVGSTQSRKAANLETGDQA